MMKSLITILLVLPMMLSQTAGATTLYQWIGKDGTPTYSPEPPPKGTPYTTVGADLQPLPDQTSTTPQSALAPTAPRAPGATAIAPAAVASVNPLQRRSSDVVMTPPPASPANQAIPQPKTVWKPVKYADDPNPSKNKPSFSHRANASKATPPINQVSAECLSVKQKLLLLESQFANAASAQEMDSAVIKLSVFRKENRGLCGLQ